MKPLRFDIYKENGFYFHYGDETPPIIKVCQCEQCKYNKGSRHSKSARKRVKRMLNKARRKKSGKIVYWYWRKK